MATEEGYDFEVLQDISSDLYCVICLKLMRNPVQFKCGHGMCYGCFKSLLQKGKQRSIAQCPQCREVVKENQIISNVMLHRLILSLKVKCLYSDNGCKWTGDLDRSEEHMDHCSRSTDDIGYKKTKKKKIKKDVNNSSVTQSFQNDLLLEITGQLSILHKKIGQLEDDRAATTTVQITQNNWFSPYGLLKSFFKGAITKLANHPLKTVVVGLTLCLCLLLTWIIWMDGPVEYKPLELNNLQRAFSQLHDDLSKIHSQIYAQQNNFFQLHLVTKELQTDVDSQKTNFVKYLAFYWRTMLNDVHYKKSTVTGAVEPLLLNQLKTISNLEKRFDFDFKNMELDLEVKIKTLNFNSILSLSVPNSTFFSPSYGRDTIRETEIKIFSELKSSEMAAITSIANTFEIARKKLIDLQQQFKTYFDDFPFDDLKQQLYEDHKKMDKIFFEKLQEEVSKEHFDRIQKNYALLTDNYNGLINESYSKYSDVFSYKNRFNNVMGKMKNINLINGKYIWLMNSTLLPLLPDKHGYYSDEFTAVPSVSPYVPSKFAKLWLLKMSSQDKFWKVTYEQEANTNVTVNISILNQLYEKDLHCIEIYRQAHDNKLQLIIDFKIPLVIQDLIKKGYIYDNKIYIRCTVTKPDKK